MESRRKSRKNEGSGGYQGRPVTGSSTSRNQPDSYFVRDGNQAAPSSSFALGNFGPGSGFASAVPSPASSVHANIDSPGVLPPAQGASSNSAPERPANRRGRSIFSFQHQRPKHLRAKSGLGRHHEQKRLGRAQINVQDNLPLNTIARLAQRTQNVARLWYLRQRSAVLSHRRTELEKSRELQRSELLFAQAFSVTPMVLLAASSLQAEESNEKNVPVVLQQLSIRVTQEQAKHYRHMLRIHLEYGAGMSLVRWEIVRGYRDLFYLRARLKSQIKRMPTKRVKLPKLPRAKLFGLKANRNRQKIYYADSDDSDMGETSSDDEDGAEEDVASDSDDGEVDVVQTDGEPRLELHTPSEQTSIPSSTISPLETPENTQPVANIPAQAAQTPQMQESDAPFETPRSGRRKKSRSSNQNSAQQQQHHHHESLSSYTKAVEDWLTKIKDLYALRLDSNVLMQFFELSHLSLKLSPEYGYHGKEGTLIVRSLASDMGWRLNHYHPRDIKDAIERHTKKWVIVKDSFIVIVNTINSTKIREVFLVDSSFSIKHIEEEYDANKIYHSAKSENKEDAVLKQLAALPDAEDVSKKKAAKSVFLHLQNNEREIKFAAMNPRELRRWQASILQMKSWTPWAEKQRFDSFAPVRNNVFGQWFVDGRDYMWVLSEALENARDTIYILDWWLSPEVYLRRPPEGNQKWRLDRVLKRKAEQGVKIFVVVYRNVGPTIPNDSLWTKHSLLDLHPNIFVMRSPHQFSNKRSLFWAHHEKLCVIDQIVAFNGGIDLCYGRWDTWQHTLTDDAPAPFLSANPTREEWENKRTQLFPGKDYSNARVKDFFELNKPFEDMYDRTFVPRMPWHDIHQMVLGQPARDFSRHFVQRWNYLMRQKLPSRPTPLLLPPSDFTQDDLERLQLTGTCEYQVLRSSGDWSLGLKKHEQSIQNAYLQLIEESAHLVYIENQFFITSTEVDGVLIENQIGNALVQRIVRAHENGENWRAFILIPLMPGFEAEVDTDKASSVRIICQCQFNSISRGPHSIFYRLESMGIRPDQYISFFSLRKWGKFSDTPDSPNGGRICTELLYIHAKCMIVDDRVAIIGSANINERSMRGLRDSEVAVCVRDTKVVESRMAGKPWKAGKFAHSLRVRLMREHLGVDMDKLDAIDRCLDSLAEAAKIKAVRVQQSQQAETQARNEADLLQRRLMEEQQAQRQALHLDPRSIANGSPSQGNLKSAPSLSMPTSAINSPAISPPTSSGTNTPLPQGKPAEEIYHFPDWLYPELHSFNWYGGTKLNSGLREYKNFSTDSRIEGNAEHQAAVDGDGPNTDHYKNRRAEPKDTWERRLKNANVDKDLENQAKDLMNELLKDKSIQSMDQFKREFYARFTRIDIMRPLKRAADLPLPRTDEEGLRAVGNESIPIDPWAFMDPLDDRFVQDRWLAAAERNTRIFRLVFRCQPDDEVETWKDYKQFQAHLERFYEKQQEDGGPSSLRRKGHHEPDRVDKYVLGGTIQRPDPEVVRQNIMKAKDAQYYHRQMEETHKPEHESPHRKLIQHTPTHNEPNHPELRRYADNIREAMSSKLTSADRRLQSGLEHLHVKSDDHLADGSHVSQKSRKHPQSLVLGEATEFGASFGGESRRPSAVGSIDNNMDKTSASNDTAYQNRPLDSDNAGHYANGHAHSNGQMNGHAKSHLESSEEFADAQSPPDKGSVQFPSVSRDTPEPKDEGRTLKPSMSATSSRWRAQSTSGSAKPPRRWGHFEHVLDSQVAEDMLQGVTGQLVVFPTEWLNRELDSGNWNFQLDRIAPLEIYD